MYISCFQVALFLLTLSLAGWFVFMVSFIILAQDLFESQHTMCVQNNTLTVYINMRLSHKRAIYNVYNFQYVTKDMSPYKTT